MDFKQKTCLLKFNDKTKDMEIKKNPKYDLRRSSIIFFQIGMILMLFFTWRAMEWTTVDAPESDVSMAEVAEDLEEVIPATECAALVRAALQGGAGFVQYRHKKFQLSDFEELRRMLEAAGFTRVRRHPTPVPLICSVVSATAP